MAPFDADKTIQYWRDGAAYDLETGRSLMEAKRFPYALFFCHLAIEKILKALVVRATKEHAPYTHSLVFLASRTGIDMPDDVMDTLAEFMEFHLEARYPDEKKDFYTRCTEEFARKQFVEAEGLCQWLIQR